MQSAGNSHSILPLDQIIQGDCVEIMHQLPEASIDLIFADPPYNLQLQQELYRPNMTRVDAVDEAWDRFADLDAYDAFSRAWLEACWRLLKDTGTIWVIGTYHNIFRIGAMMQDLGFWFLNDIIWIKTNPMPNFRGVRFTNAHETLIWACKKRGAKYTFNHFGMKELNDGLQMRSDWTLPICTGGERLRVDGKKAHSTQKPEALLYRILLAASRVEDVVLDPFFGSGTTGAVAKKLYRHFIGIEREEGYIRLARQRIGQILPEPYDENVFCIRQRKGREKRVPFASLLEVGLLQPGAVLFFRRDPALAAHIKPDGRLRMGETEGSIHQLGKQLMNGSPCNGWEQWYYTAEDGELHPVDDLRSKICQGSEI